MRLQLNRSRSRNRRHHRPWYLRITRGQVALALGAVIGVLVVIFAFQASQASSSLRLASNQAEVLQNQIVAGDEEGAKATLQGLQDSTEHARAKTAGPLWSLGAKVPYFGKNVSAVRTVSVVADDLANEAMPPLVNLSAQVNLNAFSPRNGKVDLATINKIRPSVIAAADALTKADDRLSSINASSLLVPIRGPVSTIQFKIASARSAAVTSRSAARLMPSMLGEKTTRRYLLLIQNNAEVRPTGGIAGSFAILTADKGRLSMGKQGSIQDLPPFNHPVLPMTADEQSVFSQDLVSDIRDVNVTPNFPRTAEIARAMAKKGLDVNVDGVISVDPLALSYILAGTGPVQLSDGTSLDQSNAVDVLLNGIYAKYQDNDKQDDVFQSAARKIFDVVKSGRGDSRTVIAALVNAANENRLTMWSSHEAEQAQIAPTGLAGVIGGDEGKTPHVGVYLSDAASTKMEYYLDYTTVVRTGRCLSGDIQELGTTTELVSNAPSNATRLSPYITGDGTFTPRGTMRINVRIYSPFDGGITGVRVNGKPQTVSGGRVDGRNVSTVTVTIKPGEQLSVTATMISGRGQSGDAVFSTTPGVQPTLNDVRVTSACS
jgi:hypothetical protein